MNAVDVPGGRDSRVDIASTAPARDPSLNGGGPSKELFDPAPAPWFPAAAAAASVGHLGGTTQAA